MFSFIYKVLKVTSWSGMRQMEGQHKGVDEAISRVEGVKEEKGRRGRWRDNIREWMRLCLGWKV